MRGVSGWSTSSVETQALSSLQEVTLKPSDYWNPRLDRLKTRLMEAHEIKHDRLLLAVVTTIMAVGMTVTSGIGMIIVNRLPASPGDVFEEVSSLRKEIRLLETARTDADLVLSVLEASSDAIIGLDENGKITLWSSGAESLFGVSRRDSVGFGIAFLIPEELRSRHKEKYSFAMSSKRKAFHKVLETTAIHSSGEHIPIEINVWGIPGNRSVAVCSRLPKNE